LKTIQKHKNVPVKQETYDRLVKLGTLGDTFDSVITKLLTQNIQVQAQEHPHYKQTKIDEF
jgi:predicted CopG family antitoxin